MKQFIVDRHTAPLTPTLEQVPTEKIPTYESLTDAESDLTNLNEGQIIATLDDGADELLKTVDTVEDNNMHPVTSNAVAESISYSETEQATGGKWIDGKPIYRKVIDTGALPNNTTKAVAHNISNLELPIHVFGVGYGPGDFMPLPYISSNNAASSVQIYLNSTNITIITGTDRTNYSKSYIVLEYTKTTD